MLDVEIRNGAITIEIISVLHRAFSIGNNVNCFAERIGVQELQAI